MMEIGLKLLEIYQQTHPPRSKGKFNRWSTQRIVYNYYKFSNYDITKEYNSVNIKSLPLHHELEVNLPTQIYI